MEKLERIVFIALDGEPPAGETLDVLPDPSAVAELIRSAFSPFLTNDGSFQWLEGPVEVKSSVTGLLLVYAYGHAWLAPDGPRVATRSGSASTIESAHSLLDRLIPAGAAAERTILVLDCCHAGAFDAFVRPDRTPRLLIYASGADEKAIALTGERASRMSLAIANRLLGRTKSIDLVYIVGAVAEQLGRDGVLRGQSVGYRMNGISITLARGAAAGKHRRERTVTILRNAFVAGGGVAAVLLMTLGWYYWTHTLVDLDVAGLHGIAREIRLVASEEYPGTNGSRVFAEETITGARMRLWVPTSNVLIRIEATYEDEAERALAFHLDLRPSFSPADKSLNFVLPSAAAIQSHPRMAFVPVVRWFHGRERESRTNPRPFWIDIRPPTVVEYLAVAERLLRNGQLNLENSFILTARQRSSAVDAVSLTQLHSLNRDLGAIFGAIEASTSPQVGAASDIVVGLNELPCQTCPAPMTRHEAELYCKSRKMRLPTNLEWELAVRGVDGRVYPWGNQFDESRANVPGLPDKGETSPTLKPVDAYPNERSPFGLIDTVGNAGDWVVNETDSYERVYMGATYRYNQEDATAFRMLPITDSDYLVREITVRCAVDAELRLP